MSKYEKKKALEALRMESIKAAPLKVGDKITLGGEYLTGLEIANVNTDYFVGTFEDGKRRSMPITTLVNDFVMDPASPRKSFMLEKEDKVEFPKKFEVVSAETKMNASGAPVFALKHYVGFEKCIGDSPAMTVLQFLNDSPALKDGITEEHAQKIYTVREI